MHASDVDLLTSRVPIRGPETKAVRSRTLTHIGYSRSSCGLTSVSRRLTIIFRLAAGFLVVQSLPLGLLGPRFTECAMRLRSLVSVPGDSERKLARATACGADALILDLEDSVAPPQKAA